MSSSEGPPSLPPFQARPGLAKELRPLVGLLSRLLGVGRTWLVVDEDDLSVLGGAAGEELELVPGIVLVSGGAVAEAVGGAAPSGVARRGADGRVVARTAQGGLLTEPAGPGGEEALALVGPLAEIAHAAIERAADLARAEARIGELRELSTVDPLTGLRNRRYLDRQFAYEIARRRRYERALTVLLMDLDHFKQLNDSYGHHGGDAVLRAVAGALRENLRRSDIAARIGGEEFAALLPETPLEGGVLVAERIRRTVAALDLDGMRVTVSVGLATVEGRWEGDAAALLRAADQALYRAKREGRNRVVYADVGEGSIDSSPGDGARHHRLDHQDTGGKPRPGRANR